MVEHGIENVDPEGSYVVVANHQSWVDVVVLFQSLPVIPGFMAKRELLRVPFLAAALRAGGHVVVDRQNHSSARKTLDGAAEQIRAGKSVLIFPEGTRQRTQAIGKFKNCLLYTSPSPRD